MEKPKKRDTIGYYVKIIEYETYIELKPSWNKEVFRDFPMKKARELAEKMVADHIRHIQK